MTWLELLEAYKTDDGKLRLRAYYYDFQPTGVEAIDRILSAVAIAGKMFHHTESWLDSGDGEDPSPRELIQAAANAAATSPWTAEDIERLREARHIALDNAGFHERASIVHIIERADSEFRKGH